MCRWGRHASEKAYGHGGSWLVVSCGRTSHPLGACCFDKCGWWKFFRSSIAFLSRHFWHFCCSLHQKGGLANNHLSLFWFTSKSLFLARFLEYLFVAGRQQKRTFSPIWSSTLQGTNISPQNGILKMIFLFPRWDMLIPCRVYCTSSSNFPNNFTPLLPEAKFLGFHRSCAWP